MSKGQPPGQEGLSLSPYLSFRQALRPAVFAHSVLLREKDRAGAFVEEANRILASTRELLSKAGLGYIAVSEPGVPTAATGGLGSQSSLLNAFADAAMLWAKVVGSCMALADHFLEQGQWDQVRTLAAILDDAGELGVAKSLRDRLSSAPLARYKDRLRVIKAKMSQEEIADAIDAFKGAFFNIPKSDARDVWLNSHLPTLATAVCAHIKNVPHIVGYVARGNRAAHPSFVEQDFYQVAAAFQAQT